MYFDDDSSVGPHYSIQEFYCCNKCYSKSKDMFVKTTGHQQYLPEDVVATWRSEHPLQKIRWVFKGVSNAKQSKYKQEWASKIKL
jgi:hypothetical protein